MIFIPCHSSSLVTPDGFGCGHRPRCEKSDLPGTPDIALVEHRKTIDVCGCFFPMHRCKYGSVVPEDKSEFLVSEMPIECQNGTTGTYERLDDRAGGCSWCGNVKPARFSL